MFFQWAAICFLIALVAGAFGFSDMSGGASHIGRVLFYVSLAILLVLAIAGWVVYTRVAPSVADGPGLTALGQGCCDGSSDPPGRPAVQND